MWGGVLLWSVLCSLDQEGARKQNFSWNRVNKFENRLVQKLTNIFSSVAGDAVNWLALFRIEEIHTFRFKWNRKWYWNGFHPRKLTGFASHHRRTISVPVHRTPKFFLLSHNAYERPCISCTKREHKISSRFIWLVGCWTVYSEWMMQRNATRGNFQMDSATGVKVWVVDFRGKLVSVVMIIKWAFMTSWYDLKTAFRNRKCMKLNYISVYSLRVRKFVILYYEQHWQTEQSYANRFVLKIVFVGYNNN